MNDGTSEAKGRRGHVEHRLSTGSSSREAVIDVWSRGVGGSRQSQRPRPLSRLGQTLVARVVAKHERVTR